MDAEPQLIQNQENFDNTYSKSPNNRNKSASFNEIGIDIEVNSDDEVLELSNRRIQVISGLDKCSKLKSLILVANFITKLQNLKHLTQLCELELYQNHLKCIEGIESLKNLRVLDLSFNQIRKIENLEALDNIEKLYLSSNKISKIEGLDNLIKLKLLELGSNRIRVMEGLSKLNSLEELWLGKNKISNLNIPPLEHLRVISLQSNRLISCDEQLFLNCPKLTEIYLSNNALRSIPSAILSMKNLSVLDLSSNQISSLEFVEPLIELQELWMNDNYIEDPRELNALTNLRKLNTIYLERNPIEKQLGSGYRATLLSIIPWISQIDSKVFKSSPSSSEIYNISDHSSLKKRTT